MRKLFVIIFSLLACHLPALSQNRFRFNSDRRGIDSLKELLPSLKDSARIDCLNALGDAYLLFKQIDTTQYYVAKAYEESKKINYIHGIAEAKSIEAEIGADFPKSEKLAHEAIRLYATTTNKKRLAETYYNLGFVLWAQSMFTGAIKNLETSYELFKKENDAAGIVRAVSTIAWVYEESGNYEKAFELARKGLEITSENNVWLRRIQLTEIGLLFRDIEDNHTALSYFLEALQNLKPGEYNSIAYFRPVLEIAEQYSLQQQYDSARYYYSFIDTSNERGRRFYLVRFGEYYFLQKEYNKALPNFIRGLNYHKQSNDRNQIMRTLVDMAKTYHALQNDTAALRYAREALNMAKETGAKQVTRNCYQILYSIYDRFQKADSAYFYYRQYVRMSDSVISDQVKGKLVAYSYEQRIALINKEKEIQQIQLQKESLLKKFLIIGIIAILILSFIIGSVIMLKRKNEKNRRELLENELQIQQLESKKQLAELEMQALRAQMNPHFIFNSLNSINRFILQSNKALASEYLTKFSRLVRLILQNSEAALIPLESELESLQLYLELEAVRFDHQFDYKITIGNELDVSIIKLPPLIIQPYVENAIWHGLMHKEEKGHLVVELFEQDDMLFCKITDDGIGRKKASELKSKSASSHKSMGMRITADRIAILQQKKQFDTNIKITDLVLPDGSAGGTEVLLKIPVLYD
jgi:tetratricopeptide (TPR) repeat protein